MNFKYIATFLVLFISIFLFNINKSEALKELNISTPDLARTSTDIVVAKCVSSEARLERDNGLIFTYITFSIDESLKGKYGEELVLRIVGGTVGDRTVSSPFLPKFELNEEVVLFLGPRNSKGFPVIQSVNKGIYRINRTKNGTKVVTTPVKGLTLSDSITNQRINGNNELLLDDFIYSINEIL